MRVPLFAVVGGLSFAACLPAPVPCPNVASAPVQPRPTAGYTWDRCPDRGEYTLAPLGARVTSSEVVERFRRDHTQELLAIDGVKMVGIGGCCDTKTACLFMTMVDGTDAIERVEPMLSGLAEAEHLDGKLGVHVLLEPVPSPRCA